MPTTVTTSPISPPPNLLLWSKSPPSANSRLFFPPGVYLQQSPGLNISLSTPRNTRPNLYTHFPMLSGQDLSISIYNLEFGISRAYFYCIDRPVVSNFHHIYFPPLALCCISSLHIAFFFNFSLIPVFHLSLSV